MILIQETYTHKHTFGKSKLTQSGASKGGLHCVAVLDAKSPHGDSSCSLFAPLNPKLTTLKGELMQRDLDVGVEMLSTYAQMNMKKDAMVTADWCGVVM